jgi:hypothetical protein
VLRVVLSNKARRRAVAQLSGVRADEERIAFLKRQLHDLDARRASIEAELAAIVGERTKGSQSNGTGSENGRRLGAREKIALFRRLFAGRPDVFALRWENRKDRRSGYAPACHNEWVAGVCGKPKIKCSACPNQAFIALGDDVVERHLSGTVTSRGSAEYAVGVYPLLSDNRCWFLAADFDGESWAEDARAYLEACRAKNVSAALERSRSGNGGHVWIFFAEPIAAAEARRLGAALMTEAMERRQWAFLAELERTSAARVSSLVREAQQTGRVLAVRMPVDDDEFEQPWLLTPSRRTTRQPIVGPLPKSVRIVLADGVYIARKGLPPALVACLIRTAAFANPEFYRAQAMRRSTYDKPRIVSCAELHAEHAALPRGCLDDAVAALRENGVRAAIEDRRESGAPLDIRFLGSLQPAQAEAFDALMDHDCGVLAAGTAFGKTVVAAAAIARRGRSTLVLVHRKELLAQWIERLKAFLSIEPAKIGTIGGGRRARSLGDDRRPSQVADRYWLYAERRDPESYPDHGPRGGKWLLFINTAEIDEWWAKIKAATEAGQLGGSAKVSTAKENPNAKGPKAGVICVYTHDVEDVTDCRRVREALRKLGATWKIPYKTDADTVAGRYAKDGSRVSRLYE